jgi:dipeptidyl aminopeptidase/acylaminoacyl peptidase
MDRWAMRPCDPKAGTQGATPGAAFCHDGPDSPESRLVGCPIRACPDKTIKTNPVTYISAADPPIMIIHGMSDVLVPYNQSELFYNALSKACHESVFITMPVAGHGVWYRMLTDPRLAAAATITSTSSNGCTVTTPTPYTPSWATVIEFFDKYLK